MWLWGALTRKDQYGYRGRSHSTESVDGGMDIVVVMVVLILS